MNNDKLFLVFFLGTIVFMFFAVFIIMIVIATKKKHFEYILEKKQLESEYHKQLLITSLEVQEQSFKNISEEIHDNIGQLLSITKMMITGIRNDSKEPDIAKQAGNCSDILGQAINDLRNISHLMNSTYIFNNGLENAIEKDLEYINSTKKVDGKLETTGIIYSLGYERELLIFRILQESIANAVKHGNCTTIIVSLEYQPGRLNVTIKDNGTGFDINTKPASDGLGLSNMQERAALLKGNLQVDSALGKGTTISFFVITN